jgi:hypothetical protein
MRLRQPGRIKPYNCPEGNAFRQQKTEINFNLIAVASLARVEERTE